MQSRGKQAAATEEMEASGIVIAATGNVQSQSYIWVTVSEENNVEVSHYPGGARYRSSSVCGWTRVAGRTWHHQSIVDEMGKFARFGKHEPEVHKFFHMLCTVW